MKQTHMLPMATPVIAMVKLLIKLLAANKIYTQHNQCAKYMEMIHNKKTDICYFKNSFV